MSDQSWRKEKVIVKPMPVEFIPTVQHHLDKEWNAAIEAAAEACEKLAREETEPPNKFMQAGAWLCADAVLALRRGASGG